MNKKNQTDPPNTKKHDTQNSGKPDFPKEIIVYNGDKRPTIAESLLILITLALAICNGIVIYYASIQSNAAIDAVKIADSTAIRQLRAYLGIAVGESGPEGDGKLILSFQIINKGQTPAKNVQVNGKIHILPYTHDLPKGYIPDSDYISPNRPKQSEIIFPNENNNMNITGVETDNIPSKDDLSQIELISGTKRAYAFIVITYEDIFNIKRSTFFCIYMKPETLHLEKGKRVVRWVTTQNYNDFN